MSDNEFGDGVWRPDSSRRRDAWWSLNRGHTTQKAIDTLEEFPELWSMIDRRMREFEWVRWEMLVVFLCIRVPGNDTPTGVADQAMKTALKGGWLEITDHQYLKEGPVNIYARFMTEEGLRETLETVTFYDCDRRLRGDSDTDEVNKFSKHLNKISAHHKKRKKAPRR